jgi:gliding motility-associated-like protein
MKFLLSFFFFIIFASQANASHLLGGEMYYDYLGSNNYKVTIILFRDCNATSGFDNQLHYTIFDEDQMSPNYSVFLSASRVVTNLPVDYSNPCVVPPPGLCVDQAVYIDTVNLPTNIAGYSFSYQRCCWAANIINVVNPDDFGLTLSCFLPGTNQLPTGFNSAARFLNLPPLVLCSQNELDFDHSAIDADGDSVRIFLCEVDQYALSSGSGANPDPDLPGPYLPTVWETGYSAPLPFGVASPMLLDSLTGQLTFTPVTLGNFLTGVCLEEFRDGVLINKKNRTFNFTVVNCDQVIPFSIAQLTTGASSTQLIEDCGTQYFYFSRLDSSGVLPISITIQGTATPNVDMSNIPDTFFMMPGEFNDTLAITAFYDSLAEPNETVTLTLSYFDICSGENDSLVATFIIRDYTDMSISTPNDSVNVCPDLGEAANIGANLTGGQGPYNYDWFSGQFEFIPNAINVQIPPSDITELENAYYVTVTDACFKSIISDTIWVHNQCPLSFANVYSPNGDGINDIFLIPNIDDYPAVKLTIFNRWGNIIYLDSDYTNNWDLKTYGGEDLADGTYFYTAEVINDKKYIYDDQKEIEFIAHGFFQIVR